MSLGYPVYVLTIDADKNRVVVGTIDELTTKMVRIDGVNIMKDMDSILDKDFIVKVRSMDKGTPARVVLEPRFFIELRRTLFYQQKSLLQRHQVFFYIVTTYQERHTQLVVDN